MDRTTSIVITDEMYEKLIKISKKMDRSVSWVIREAVKKFLEEKR